MKKAIPLIPAIALAMCLLSACSTEPEPEPEPGPAPEPVPAATPEPTPAPVTYLTLTITNASPYDIKELWVSYPAGEEKWEAGIAGVESPLPGPGGLAGDVLKTDDSAEGVIVSIPENEYGITVLDEDDDEFSFSGAALADRGEMVLSWNGSCYLAEMFDEAGEMYATLESEAAGDNGGEITVRPKAKFESKVLLNDLDLIVNYPSKAFHVLDVEDEFVKLQSNDGKALIEICVNEPWDGPERGAMNTAIRRYESIAKAIISEKTEGADEVRRHDTDIVRTDYEGISNLLYIYSSADYTQGGQPMHTLCMVNRWYRVSDFAPYLFSVTLTTTMEMLEFYTDNYYYKIADSLNDRPS